VLLILALVTAFLDYRLVGPLLLQQFGYYPSVNGQIASCEFKEIPGRRGSNTPTFSVTVTYTYEVEGRVFQSQEEKTFWDRPSAAQFRDQHHPAAPIRVFYDPAKPGEEVPLPRSGLQGADLVRLLMIACWNSLFLFYLLNGLERHLGVRRMTDKPGLVQRAYDSLKTAAAALSSSGWLSLFGLLVYSLIVPAPISRGLMIGVWGANAILTVLILYCSFSSLMPTGPKLSESTLAQTANDIRTGP